MSDLTPLDDEYNPLDLNNLARQLADRVLEVPAIPLTEIKPCEGSGVYALYYRGDFPAYAPLIEPGAEDIAIYVGRAVGSVRTGQRKADVSTRYLHRRIVDHRKSIRQAENLEEADFMIRRLIVAPVFVPLAESGLIERSQPAWNGFLPGFGSKDPGEGRAGGVRSEWDTLHPGRGGVVPKLPPNPRSASAIELDVVEYLRSRLA